MKEIKVLSQGQILSEEVNLNNKLVISFHNSSDYNIIEKQKVALITHQGIYYGKSKNNLLFEKSLFFNLKKIFSSLKKIENHFFTFLKILF